MLEIKSNGRTVEIEAEGGVEQLAMELAVAAGKIYNILRGSDEGEAERFRAAVLMLMMPSSHTWKKQDAAEGARKLECVIVDTKKIKEARG